MPTIPPRRFDILAIGFATSTAMWAVAYVSFMQPGLILGEALFAIMLACLFAGGFVAARQAGRTWRGGAAVGLVSALVNLLMVGAQLTDPVTHRLRPDAGWWILGALIISITLAAAGAAAASLAASRKPPRERRQIDWLARFTIVAAVTVFLLLITGGLVTGLKAGLAVPDWPRSFGHNMLLYPISQMTGGVYFEHAHRLYGMLVGLTAITLAILLWLGQRRWVACLGTAYLLMVITQGVLGGTRVTEKSLLLATVHGIFGQVVFATIVAIAAIASPAWATAPMNHRRTAAIDRTMSMLLLFLLLTQLTLGATYRHMQEWSGASEAALTGALHGHVLVAVLVLAAALFCAIRAMTRHADVPLIRRIGKALLIVVCLQVLLGVGALIAVVTTRHAANPVVGEVIITTAHQATGALLLAIATLLALWTRRLLAAAFAAAASAPIAVEPS